jgi:hypothetical protein
MFISTNSIGEHRTLVDLFDGRCNHGVFVDGDASPSQTLFDLFQLDNVAGEVLALIPFEVDLVSHFGFFSGGYLSFGADVVNEGSGGVLGVARVFVVSLTEEL